MGGSIDAVEYVYTRSPVSSSKNKTSKRVSTVAHSSDPQISPPSPTTLYMSITTVFFDSQEIYAGQYHKHPYGEINCVVPIDDTFELEGLPVGENWQGAGWTSLAPGTHHYPRARGGRGVALFFLPSGRIAYDAKPGESQPSNI
jgi:hypothetical protein